MSAFRDMFGNFTTGRIGRLRFVVLILLLGAAMLATGLVLGFGAAIGNVVRDAAVQSALPAMRLAGLLVFLAVSLAIVVGSLNLVAKRSRDIGWHPVLLVVLFLISSGLVSIVLALVPGGQRTGA